MTYIEEWFIVSETHAPDLVCRRTVRRTDGPQDVIGSEEVPGPVMIITEHEYRLDASGLVIGLVDTRTRLVVRSMADVSGNGSEYGITPLVVEDDELYQNFVFTAREKNPTVLINDDSSELRELRELHVAHTQVMRTLDEITRLRDEIVQIRDAALRAASATRKARGG